jgi:hypothetical protein
VKKLSESGLRDWQKAKMLDHQHFLDNGESFDKIAPKRLPKHRHFKMDNRTQGQGSYANSQRFAQAYPGVKYYEGFRFAGLVPVNFA